MSEDFYDPGNQPPNTIVKPVMSIFIANRTARHRLLAVAVAFSFGFAACGADDTVDAGVPAEESLPDRANEGDVEPEAEVPVTDGFTPMAPRTDLVSLQAIAPDEVVANPQNDRQLLIHFVGAAEPCSGAAVTVTEASDEVTVVLEVGLDPNAAAMSCIAQVFDYEIIVDLDAPLDGRTIVIG